MNSHSKETYPQLLHKLQQQTKWYKTLLQLGEQETLALRNADNQQLQKISQDTHKAQTRIEQLDKQIKKLLNSYPDKNIVKRDQQISRLVKGIENLLATLIKRNATNVRVVQDELKQLREELKHLAMVERISRGYQKLPSVDSKFLDCTS
ncbi:flagellar export chaperone FlgN [bacterium]|nr:flagellar export chaperone FlgN [bacterium]